MPSVWSAGLQLTGRGTGSAARARQTAVQRPKAMYSRIVSSTLQSSTTREAWSVTARGNTSACCREGAPQIVSQTRLAPRLKSFRANDAHCGRSAGFGSCHHPRRWGTMNGVLGIASSRVPRTRPGSPHLRARASGTSTLWMIVERDTLGAAGSSRIVKLSIVGVSTP